MANTVTLTYGGTNISPVPFMSISKNYDKAGDGRIIGTTFNLTLDGTVTPVPTGTDFNITSVTDLMDDIRDIFAKDGHRLHLECDGTTLLDAYPRINSVKFDRDNTNWVLKAPYTVELEFDDEPDSAGEDAGIMPPYIRDASETWDVEFADDSSLFQWGGDTLPYVVRISHSVSAVGKRHYQASSPVASGSLDKDAWEQARDYVIDRLGYNAARLACTGILNIDTDIIAVFNHMRNCNTDELGGSVSVTESWMGVPTGIEGVISGALEDFTVNVSNSAGNGLTNIAINGTIQGLEQREYGSSPDAFTIHQSKFEAASGYFGTVKSRLFNRAVEAYETADDNITEHSRDVNSIPVDRSVGYSPKAGTISYNYNYDTRPCNFITNAIAENIVVNDTHPTNVFASIVVLGRANGPILQDISTVTAGTRSVSIEAIMPPPSGCTAGAGGSAAAIIDAKPSGATISGILCGFENDLTTSYSQVFKSADSESWNVKTGQYSRNVQWTFNNCDGVAPATSFC